MRMSQNILLVFVAGLIAGTVGFAQHTAPAAQIVEQIDESQLTAIKGNTPLAATHQNDRGPVSPSLPMTDLLLVLRRSPDQQAAFDEFVASQYDPSSPNYHQWLAPQEVAETFGPSSTDIAVISRWLSGHGLLINEVAKDQMSLRFSGNAAQVESTFHTAIHNLSVNGESHIGNMNDPQIPTALATVVAGVKALHDFFPRTLHRTGGVVRFNLAAGMWQRANVAEPTNPEFGINVGSGSTAYTIEDLAPYDFATIYNVLPLWNSNIDGTGQTIAIAGTSDINTADVSNFRSFFGLPAGTPPQTIIANGTDPGQCTSTSINTPCTIDDLIENTLDVEWSGAVAKGASIVLVVSGSNSATTDTVYSSANYVVQNGTANILSVSYGQCELGMGTSGNAAYNNLWETAATEGISVFVASGDAGSATCDQGLSGNPPHAAEYGLSVSGMASTPYNTAVGGTDLNWGSTASPYWAASNNSSNGSNALNYVPEVPWNDTCTNPLALNYLQQWAAELQKNGYNATSPTDAETACNFVNLWWLTIAEHTSPQVNISEFLDTIGGGGGASNCTTSDGATLASCAGGYAKPSWQSGVEGVPADGARDLPDASFFAGNGFLGSAYLICVSASGSCVTSKTLTTNPVAQEVGGTSVASPAMAGVMALINQKIGIPQGNPNAELYALAGKQNYANCSSETSKTNDGCYFNDPDSGTNAMACSSGSPNCMVVHTGDSMGILSGYSAGAGFDPATGLGSLNVANVVNGWTSTVGTAKATVTVTPAQSSFPLSQSLSVPVTVSGSNGTPTGTVSLIGGGYSATAGTLSGGSYTFTIPGDALSTGADTLKVSYSGDPTYAMATGSASVTVAKLTPTVTEQVSPDVSGPSYGGVNVSATVTGAGPASTGIVTVSLPGYSSSPCTLTNGQCIVLIPVSYFPSGSQTITASYSGDSHYLAGTGTITVLTPTVTVTPSQTSLTTADTLQVTAKVAAGTGSAPTGWVNLSGLYQQYGAQEQLSGGSITFSVTPGLLAAGASTLTLVYQGDTTYLPAIGTTTVTVTKVTPTITVTPSASSITSNLPLTVTGTLSGAVSGVGSSPTGNVTVTAAGQQFSVSLFYSGDNYSITIPAGTLSAGTDGLTANYSGDAFNNAASNSTTVNVTQWVQVASAVTLTPESSTIESGQALPLTIAVTGAYGPPTGTVTISGGGYTGPAWQLNGGSANFTVPVNSLNIGTDTLTASYTGDPTYLPSTTTTQVTVAQSGFTLVASTTATIPPGGLTQSTITASSTTGYTGSITFTCMLSAQPAGAQDLPTCTSVNGVYLAGNGGVGYENMNVSTTAATSALIQSMPRAKGRIWINASRAALALAILLWIPARRHRWKSMLGIVILLAAFGSLGACGGSGGSGGGGGGGGGGNPGTTAGTYTFTVTGNGNPAVAPAPTTTFTVTVN